MDIEIINVSQPTNTTSSSTFKKFLVQSQVSLINCQLAEHKYTIPWYCFAIHVTDSNLTPFGYLIRLRQITDFDDYTLDQ